MQLISCFNQIEHPVFKILDSEVCTDQNRAIDANRNALSGKSSKRTKGSSHIETINKMESYK